jgi:hypothetical protein
MAYPTVDNNHAAEAQALLTDHYRNQTVVPALLASFMPSVQALENTFWQIINSFLLANTPTGDQLNALGGIVGASRGSLDDADYFKKVLLQIRVNRSQGLSEDIIQVATIYLNGQTPLPLYLDMPNASFLVEISNLPSPYVLQALLPAVRSVAIYGELRYSTWSEAEDQQFANDSEADGVGTWDPYPYTGTSGGMMYDSRQV